MNIFQKFKFGLILYDGYKKIKEAIKMKKFFEREFLLTLATWLAAVWMAVQGMIDAELTIKIMAGAAGAFALARGIAKITTTTKDDEFLDELEKRFKPK